MRYQARLTRLEVLDFIVLFYELEHYNCINITMKPFIDNPGTEYAQTLVCITLTAKNNNKLFF